MDHLKKRHNSGLFATMGGPFDRHFFLLEIFGDLLVTAEITCALGRPPDESYAKGDERPKGSQYYKTGAWKLKSGEIKVTDQYAAESHFESWVDGLPDDPGAWSKIKEKYEVRVRLVGYTDQWNAEFVVSVGALKGLSERGLPLMLDPYLSLDETEA